MTELKFSIANSPNVVNLLGVVSSEQWAASSGQ